MEFGEKVKKLRIQNGFTMRELADIIGYKSTGNISDVEQGNVGVSADKLQAIAAAFNLTVDELLSDVDNADTLRKARPAPVFANNLSNIRSSTITIKNFQGEQVTIGELESEVLKGMSQLSTMKKIKILEYTNLLVEHKNEEVIQ